MVAQLTICNRVIDSDFIEFELDDRQSSAQLVKYCDWECNAN